MFDASTGTYAANKVMRELGESGAVGRVDKTTYAYNESKVSLGMRIPGQGEIHYSWVSPDVVSIDQIVGAEIVVDKGGEIVKSVIKAENFMPAVGGTLGGGDPEISMCTLYCIVPTQEALDEYNAMADDSAGSGMEMGKLPGIGLYFTDNDISFGDGVKETARTLSISKTTIHPIDPKYLPGYVKLNLDDFGINIATLAMSGGGQTVLDIDHTAFWGKIGNGANAFSTDIMPGMHTVLPINGVIFHAVNGKPMNATATFTTRVGSAMLRATLAFEAGFEVDSSEYASTTLIVTAEQISIP